MRNDPRRRDLAAYPFAATLEMRFGDMDVWHHLNNVAAVRFYEEGRIRFLAELRRRETAWERYRMMVAHASVDYLAEGKYPRAITVAVGIVSLGSKSFRFGEALFQEGRCIGLADVVLTHIGDDGPSPLPDAMRATLEKYLIDPA